PEVFGTGNEFTVVNANGSYTYKIVVRGDNNGDGKINSTDALAVLKHSVQSAVMEDDSKLNASDLDHNGSINSSDALAILQISVGTKIIANDYNPGVVK
ncbi:MAG: dockerin type I repeat-containing protein, partial [Acutalibacteraceae bacterium]|nr:dockerin type I repeat-containing protein [Acutalibacteraceae bacterium]